MKTNQRNEFVESIQQKAVTKWASEMSDNIIALMPWFTISDSDVRIRKLMDFGLKSLTLLHRKTFQYARIQTDYNGQPFIIYYE